MVPVREQQPTGIVRIDTDTADAGINDAIAASPLWKVPCIVNRYFRSTSSFKRGYNLSKDWERIEHEHPKGNYYFIDCHVVPPLTKQQLQSYFATSNIQELRRLWLRVPRNCPHEISALNGNRAVGGPQINGYADSHGLTVLNRLYPQIAKDLSGLT